MSRQRMTTSSALVAIFLAFGLLVSAQGPPQRGQAQSAQSAQPPAQSAGRGGGSAQKISPTIQQRAARERTVRVIVELQVSTGAPSAEATLPGAPAVLAQRQRIAAARDNVLAVMARRQTVREVRRYSTVPYLALEVDSNALADLEASGDVVRVVDDALHTPSLAESVPRIEGDQVWAAGYDGAGTAIAILDSGVDAAHPFLGGKVVAEACFSSTVAGLSESVCPDGSTTQVGAGAAAPCDLDNCFHGTHVAGIAAGNGDALGVPFSGVAKAADIVGVQVFSDIIDSATCGGEPHCLGAFSSDIIAGLEHAYSLALGGSLNLASVNMSLGGGSFTATCDAEPFKPIIDNLRAIGIATIVAAGNNYEAEALSSPACISSTVSVGATTATDEVAFFSNVAPFLSLFAPGEGIISAFPGDEYEFLSGTSMAAPHVAGVWAVMKQALPSATVDELLAALQSTGLPVTDTRSWGPGTTTVPRVRMFQALSSLTPLTNPAPQLASVSPPTVRAGLPATLTLVGGGFNASSVARWDGVDLETTTNSITKLTAVVPAELLTVGTFAVSVFNPSPGGGESVQISIDVLPPPSLTVDKTLVGPGTQVTVTLTNGFGNQLDWLAVAATGSAGSSFVQSTFVGAGVLNRTWTVTMPATPGDYEFRLFLNNGFVQVATSPTVTVDGAISPTPVVTSMSPTEAVAGSAGLTLTVLGSQFVPSSVVHWNGAARATTFVSSTQVRATISASDLAAAGAVPVTVFTPSPGGGTSSSLSFNVIPAPSLSVSATSVAAGGSVTVTLTNGLGGTQDWLSFGAVGAADNGYLQFIYVGGGVPTRTWTVTAPTTPGGYEFRLFRQGTFVRLATSATVTVEAPPAPELTVSETTVAGGQPVTVTLTNGLGGSQDWLSFGAVGAADNGYLQFIYVGAGVTTRTWTVTAPTTAGTYEFRLFKQGSFVRAATSPPVTVTGPPPPSPALSVSATTVPTGGSVTVTLTNGAGGSSDWLAFAATGSANTTFVQSTTVGAGVTTRTWTVTAPSTAGTYEFRLFLNGGYTRAATSPTVTVEVPTTPVPELAVSATSVTAGAPVTVTLTGGPGGSSDWMAFAATGAANSSYVHFVYVGAGVTTRTWTVNTPATPGTYEFRLFKQGTYTRLATSPAVTVVAPPDPVLTPSESTVVSGSPMTVTLTNGLGGSQDFFTIAAVGSSNTSYLQFAYVGAGVTTRTWTVTAPANAGQYEFRLYKQGSWVRLATSAPVTVQAAPPPVLTLSASTVAPGSQVTVTLTNGQGGNSDWLAFAPTGAADNGYLQYVYVGAGVTTRTWTVTVPTTPGTYEFRLYKQASFVRLATSGAVTVVAGGG